MILPTRTAREGAWCSRHEFCKGIDVPGFEGGRAAMLCTACEAERLTEEAVQWEPAEAGSPVAGVLAVGLGDKRGVYAVAELPAVEGLRCFVLRKIEGGTDPEANGYGVRCKASGEPWSCDCRGWLRWNRCRHTDAIRELIENHKL